MFVYVLMKGFVDQFFLYANPAAKIFSALPLQPRYLTVEMASP